MFPRDLCWVPNFYKDYTASSLSDIFRRHTVMFHIYADGTQIYLPFLPEDEDWALTRLEVCLTEVCQWMATNWLKLNDSKTEFIIFGSKRNLSYLINKSITIGECTIHSDVACVKSLGAYCDRHLKCDKHVTFMCKTVWYQLFQMSKIKQFLTIEQLKSVIHAYATFRIDQNNSLLLELPKEYINHLQYVLNAASKLILGLKNDIVTPVFITLHWLSVEYRSLFKVLLLTLNL